MAPPAVRRCGGSETGGTGAKERNGKGRVAAAARRAGVLGVVPIILLMVAGAAALLLGHGAGVMPG